MNNNYSQINWLPYLNNNKNIQYTELLSYYAAKLTKFDALIMKP